MDSTELLRQVWARELWPKFGHLGWTFTISHAFNVLPGDAFGYFSKSYIHCDCINHGRRNRGSRVSGCSPNFWGAGAVLPRKFGDVTDWRWWLFTCSLLQLQWCCASFIIAYLQPAIRDTNLLEHTVHSVHFRAVEVGFKKPRFLGF